MGPKWTHYQVSATLEHTDPRRSGEVQLTDGLHNLLAGGQKIYGLRSEDRRHDAGDKLRFLRATWNSPCSVGELRCRCPPSGEGNTWPQNC